MSRLPHRRRPGNPGVFRPPDHAAIRPIRITLWIGGGEIMEVERLDASPCPGIARLYRCDHPASGRTYTVCQNADLSTECDCPNLLDEGACFHVRNLTRAGLLLEVETFDQLVDCTTFDGGDGANLSLVSVGEDF